MTEVQTLSVGEARARYFAEAGFPPDGGYAAKFVQLAKLGPIPLGFPNSAARRRAVALHDLHHVATGYRTDWTGEAEISAWEIASGCGGFWFAWFINLQGMVMGWFVAPAATWRAFQRGRHSRNLYGAGFCEALLRESVGGLRARLGLDRPSPAPGAGDFASYAVWCWIAAAEAALLLAPLALAAGWLVRALSG
ncbi:MAG TPA: hypothetical protein VEI82_10910 [Myxococcota bacterium]|nr:hypothetical protein [Myxococcota bacterium]